jgi:hypothetical protein
VTEKDIIMNETDYLNQWMNGSPYQAFFSGADDVDRQLSTAKRGRITAQRRAK